MGGDDWDNGNTTAGIGGLPVRVVGDVLAELLSPPARESFSAVQGRVVRVEVVPTRGGHPASKAARASRGLPSLPVRGQSSTDRA